MDKEALMARRVVVMALTFGLANSAWAADRLPVDAPTPIGDTEAVCTGIGLDSRQDPRWSSYPLRIEVAGRGGQYLGDVALTVARDNKEVVTVRCDGPWILFRLPAGRYQIWGETEGKTVESTALVPPTGQGRVILRFSDLGGQSTTVSEPAQ